MERTISAMVGKGSLNHNNRTFVAKNVDENRIRNNICYVKKSLKKLYPDYLGKIDYFSAYMANTGKQYENHYLTILQWAKHDEQKRPRAEPKKSGFPDYSFKKGESY